MGFIAGAIAGAAFGLLRTAVEDLLQDDAPDQAKIDAVKEAQQKRMEELLAEGMPRPKAFDQAKAETREAMKEAMAVTDNVTMGDYIGNMTTDALMGGGLGWASGTARGASALNKAKSFLGRGVKPGDASPIPGVKTDIRGMGAASDIRGMGQSSLNPQMAPGRMPAVGNPSIPPMDPLAAPGPSTIPTKEIDAIIDAAMANKGRVQMPVIDPKQGAMGRMSFLDR